MREIGVLLYRDWLEFKRKYISYILLWFSFPMILYLCIVVPFDSYIVKVNLMNYKNWSSPGIWICSSGILSFIYSYIKLKNLLHKEKQLYKYLKAPLSNGQFLIALVISSIVIGIIQLSISILITTSLNNDYLHFAQLFFIFLNVITILLFCSLIGLLFAIYIKDDFFVALIFFIFFIFLSFSFGTFIPIHEFPNKFLILIRSLPFYQIILNIQLLYAGKNIMILPLAIMNIINIIMFIIILALSYKKFRK